MHLLQTFVYLHHQQQQNDTDMTTSEKIFTQEYIKFPNGIICSIYKQMTKKGIRWYRYYRGRFQIISRTEIDQLIIELN